MAGTVLRREAETGPGVIGWRKSASTNPPPTEAAPGGSRSRASRTDRNTHLPAGIPAWLFRYPDGGARAVRRARQASSPCPPGTDWRGPVPSGRWRHPCCISWRFRAGAHGSTDQRPWNRKALLKYYRRAVSIDLEEKPLVIQFAPFVELVTAVGALPGVHEPDGIGQIEGVGGACGLDRFRQDAQSVVALRGPRIGVPRIPRPELADECLLFRARRVPVVKIEVHRALLPRAGSVACRGYCDRAPDFFFFPPPRALHPQKISRQRLQSRKEDHVGVAPLQFVDRHAEVSAFAGVRPLVDQLRAHGGQRDAILIAQILSVAALFPDHGEFAVAAVHRQLRQRARDLIAGKDGAHDVFESAASHGSVVGADDQMQQPAGLVHHRSLDGFAVVVVAEHRAHVRGAGEFDGDLLGFFPVEIVIPQDQANRDAAGQAAGIDFLPRQSLVGGRRRFLPPPPPLALCLGRLRQLWFPKTPGPGDPGGVQTAVN